MNEITKTAQNYIRTTSDHNYQFVTMTVADQLFGISVYSVRDVLLPQKITPIPLSSREIVGSLNLRGRIVTAIDLRKKLNISSEISQRGMNIVVEHRDDLYSLIVDSVGDVVNFPISSISHNPENLSDDWADVSLGVYQMQGRLLIILDVNKLIRV